MPDISLPRPDYVELLAQKYGDEKQEDGRPMYDDPVPNQSENDNSLSFDDSMIDINSL